MKFSFNLSVEYKKLISINEIVDSILLKKSPNVILWYIGARGLKQQSVDFYRNQFLYPIFYKNNTSNFWLLDLTAWNAIKDKNAKITSCSRHSFILDQGIHNRIKCIKTSDIFCLIQSLKDKAFIDYFKKALKRDFIWKKSAVFNETSIMLNEILNCKDSILSEFDGCDAGKSYSMLQYLEAFLIIEKIILNQTSMNVELCFILPNDEIDYYEDTTNSFERDLLFFLQKKVVNRWQNFNIRITFYSFLYGKSLTDRPYNASGSSLKKQNLSFNQVVGEKINLKEGENGFIQ